MSHEQLDLNTLRRAFTAAGPPHGECPSPEHLWAGTRGELAAAERDALLDHIAACPACTEDWRLAVAFARESRAPLKRFVQRIRRLLGRDCDVDLAHHPAAVADRGLDRVFEFVSWHVRPWLAAAAAASLLVVAGVGLHQQSRERAVGVERGDAASGLRSPLDDALLLRSRPRLWWVAPPDAKEFAVEVWTEDLERVASARGLTSPEYVLPAAVVKLPPGTQIQWTVTAERADGSTVRSTFVTELQ